jgi:hypothetical protein
MAFAPRPHVEVVHLLDLPAREVLLPGANKPARLIVLSESPVNKAVSAVLDLPPDWRRDPGYNPNTFMEHYLLAGDLRVGREVQLLPHHYFRTEIGAAAGPYQTRHGARVLFFTEGDPLAWRAVTDAGDDLHEGLKWIDTNQQTWCEVFTVGSRVMPSGARLLIKLLHIDPETRAYTRLIKAMAGWHDDRIEHHLCVEEAYTIAGHMTYSFGTQEPDAYFYRPPLLKHGCFQAHADGTVWLIRSDGEILNLYTDQDGTPLNWDAGTDREPVFADPQRSARAGAWTGAGQHVTPIPPRRPGLPDPVERAQTIPEFQPVNPGDPNI